MAFGPNRAAARPQTSFQLAGGVIIKYRHPFLAGQVSDASPIDEVDVSRCLKLNSEFFSAEPAQDNAVQEVLVDGSVVTITNHLLNGSATLQVTPGKGTVGRGDLIVAAQLVIASKDDMGGTLTVTQFIDGKRRVTVFYGVSWQKVPHLKLVGNAVPVYPMVMLYSGWVQGISGSDSFNERTIWAVGNKYGLKAVFKPYSITEAENNADFFGGKPYTDDSVDSNTADIETPAGNQTTAGALNDALVGASIDAPVPKTGAATSPVATDPSKWPDQR
jgi:hypothetical protein